MITTIERITKFNADRTHRFTLWREFPQGAVGTVPLRAPSDYCMFIGLNPSTADETKDDPTIRRCIRFAKDWGYGALLMTNIFAFRATDPKVMKAATDPVGAENDDALLRHASNAGVVIAAWGTHGTHLYRGVKVKMMLKEKGVELKCLRKTAAGHPEHPLYLPATLTPIPL